MTEGDQTVTAMVTHRNAGDVCNDFQAVVESWKTGPCKAAGSKYLLQN